jgi:predicted P-loop ATPase
MTEYTERSPHPNIDALVEEERLEREEFKRQKKLSNGGYDERVNANGAGMQMPESDPEMARQLRIDIGQLNGSSPSEVVAAILERIGLCAPDEISRERLLATVKGQTGTSIRALRRQMEENRKQEKRSQIGFDGLIRSQLTGAPLPLESNAITVARSHPQVAGLFALDEFRQRPMLMRTPPWARREETFPRPTRDADLVEFLAWLQRQGIHIQGKNTIRTVLASIIRDCVFHSVRDYLDGLVWDGKPRLDSWLIHYLGVEPIENYTGPAGRWWMLSAVARIYQPGCLAKYVLIIEGPQDLGKSSVFAALGGEWFTDDIAALGSKDSIMQVGNAWIVELAELDSMRRVAVSTIKAFISRKVDQFRPPYGEHIIAQPRQCALGATVNPAGHYLNDKTGAVRFWPQKAVKIDLAALQSDRDQLWAEAVVRYKSGEQWWPDNSFEPQAEQEARSESVADDPWYDLVEHWLQHQSKAEFSIYEILTGAVAVSTVRMDKRAERRVGVILRYFGYEARTVRVPGSPKTCRRWVRKPEPGSV